MTAAKTISSRGRPPKFRPEFVQQARVARAEFGAGDEAVARFLGVDMSTLRRWKAAHSDFRKAMSEPPLSPDQLVSRALRSTRRGRHRRRTVHILPPHLAEAVTDFISAVVAGPQIRKPEHG